MSAVYDSIVGLLLGAAGLIRMLAPGALTRMRDAAIDGLPTMVK